ncbi:hypothetical protein DPMN_069180 [Dreissena polymorpha]|uniref:Uncharacterized protein n=1 Tax=Dreissena polymorpha TaxID=45954 RepID=A0A9D3Z0L9_DREPO|nr:hypothetical protein DPMN_069180 [Dreissena polymorpha]
MAQQSRDLKYLSLWGGGSSLHRTVHQLVTSEYCYHGLQNGLNKPCLVEDLI